ncbi:MAG: hypothetical protein KGL39_12960 [Patescibacteria group bacterium]|nr:hypothetical protein [Patescibacteria group bacterium]
MKVVGKDRRTKSLVYGGLTSLDFSTFNLGPSVLSTAIQARMPLCSTWQIGQVSVVLGGTAAGTCSFNIVAGEGAEGSTMVDDTSDSSATAPSWTINSASGTKMFASDQVLTMTAGLVQTFTPAFPNGLWGSCELTVRIVTNISATTSENLTVILWGRSVDIHPTAGMNTATNFSWANI